ncbi:membrane protein DedA with SNARE-associated domain [Krasilnikovia cinnamomea]|uniref:Membrane protein DedA with SNARE-associated domain n=2 Tax=Krasilnikovia cinnamomea TaxID=349313 RepID=A0A4Q7ZLD9_9ACTN|nr:membrane protein DedA with SNARE-associated domain [Krasilnikovia cinnamomea]
MRVMPVPMDDLPSFLHGVAPILDRWGYLAVGAVIGVESFGVPAPGQTIMMIAAVYAGAGRLNVFAVGLIAFVAAVLGDNIGYWIGKRGGRRVVNRFGKYILITPKRLEKAERFFAKRGSKVVVVARFVEGLRQLNGVIAGLTNMPWRQFLLYNAIGAALWCGWWTTVSYLLGTHIFEVVDHVHQYKWWAIAAALIAVAAYAGLHMRHIRSRRAQAEVEREESRAG